jgi:hypothetical protein
MAKPFTPQILTANDLIEGDVVFLSIAGWTRNAADARVATTAEQAATLADLGSQDEAQNRVIGAYLVDVTLASGAPFPLLRREAIRADGGPTIAYCPVDEPAVAA